MTIRKVGLIVLLAGALASCVNERVAAPNSTPSFSVAGGGGGNTYVVRGTGNSLPADFASSVQAAGGTLTASLDAIGVAIATSSDPSFAANLAGAQGVQSVDEDVMLDFEMPRVGDMVEMDASGDPGVAPASVGSVETFRALQWAPDAIHAPAAWDAGYQGLGARVAVIDGGIRATHIDIAPNLDVAHSRSFVPGQPFNFDQARDSKGVCRLSDSFWHATHVAGIIAAPANNLGTVGIAPKATIIGVKALHCGSGSFSWIIQAIYYAATPIAAGGAGANVINMSLGAAIDGRGAGIAHLLDALSRATSYANQLGVTVVAAAGNDAIDLDHTGNLVFVPAQSVGVLAIAATGPVGWALGATNVDRPASYTNYGQSAINFAAPGGDNVLPGTQTCSKPAFPSGTVSAPCWVMDMVMAPCRGSGSSNSAYCWADGTSMAAPEVSGVAALIIGKYGPMPPAQVRALLMQSADDLGKPGNDDFYGLGRVNAGRAVQ